MNNNKGYRLNAAAVVFNRDKKVAVFKREKSKNDKTWQLPQGGIEEGETYSEAAKRELWEETGIKSVKLIKTLDYPLKYDFPEKVTANFLEKGITSKGQAQYYSLFYFWGNESEINFNVHKHREFKAYRWADIKDIPNLAWKTKRKVYEKAVEVFEPIINNFDVDSM